MAEGKTTFDGLKLNKQLLNAIEECGYKQPTPIQQEVIPQALSGQDIMGVAQTGTGKTAAYLLPILMKLKFAQEMEPRALILAPTRELVLQIYENFKDLSKYQDLRGVALYGGIGPKNQIEEIEKGTDLIIATPGRFHDLYKKGILNLKKIKTLVLDEADRMMDMGFMPQIRSILEIIPVKRQNLLFSATMPEKVVKLSEEFLEFPQVIEVTPQATAAETVEQELYFVPNLRTKINLLEYFLKKEEFKKILIFTRTKANADNVYKYIDRKQLATVRVIHANKGQNSRINAINEFQKEELRVLVSTDVTARGIDITDVSHVINFDVPILYEDYVHRIGRTGRARKVGKAITMADPAEEFHISKIEDIIRDKIPTIPLPEVVKIEKTPFEEKQRIEREIDALKRREDPEFKGAFHEKKKKFPKNVKKSKPSKKRRR
ncbi:MAG: DEAD/DEAH box helicase [Candidatus Cyclobacteriaceae bacterium M2_1C_046]